MWVRQGYGAARVAAPDLAELEKQVLAEGVHAPPDLGKARAGLAERRGVAREVKQIPGGQRLLSGARPLPEQSARGVAQPYSIKTVFAFPQSTLLTWRSVSGHSIYWLLCGEGTSPTG